MREIQHVCRFRDTAFGQEDIEQREADAGAGWLHYAVE